jgi:hypothetical protein
MMIPVHSYDLFEVWHTDSLDPYFGLMLLGALAIVLTTLGDALFRPISHFSCTTGRS